MLVLTLSSCDRRVPKISDAQLEKLHQAYPGITQDCLDKVKFGGLEAMPDRTDQCFRMTPQQRWRGLWRDAFEGSRFCPAPARQCRNEDAGDRIWLNSRAPLGTEKQMTGRLYAIEFLGRRTLERGHHGHFGVSEYEIIVDKLISLTSVESQP